MKKISKFIWVLVVLLCLSGTACAQENVDQNRLATQAEELGPDTSDTGREAETENAPVYINRGRNRELCQEMLALFKLPENKNFLYTMKQTASMSLEERLREDDTRRLLFISKTGEFKNFSEPVWENVSNEEALSMLPDFINWLHKEQPQIKGFGGASIELGRDFRIQKAQIDMNLDGSPETVYRTVSIDNGFLQVKGSATNFIAILSKRHGALITPGNHLRGQIVLYKGEPVFLNRESDLWTLSANPSLETGKIHSVDPLWKYKPLGCTFSTSDKYIGD